MTLTAAQPAGSRAISALERPRLDSVDLLRGLVMVVMALDHVRDFLTNARFEPTDLTQTTSALFLTRWITHFCAPVFMFLAGVGVSLSSQRGKSKAQLARFLLSRGVWLILLEFTVFRFGWSFRINDDFGLVLLVIWALGVSMIALAGFIFMPRALVAALSLGMICLHNLFDPVHPDRFGAFGPIWAILHEQRPIELPFFKALVAYPLIPWVGVMAAGYLLGPLFALDPPIRRRRLCFLGLGLTLAFLLLRAANLYGDPEPWSRQRSPLLTVFSFLNTTKYPPSLLYLLMTLGPAIVALAFFERANGSIARFLITFGRVPFFFYLLHIYLIHGIALVAGVLQGFRASALCSGFFDNPQGFGFGLAVIYAVWIGVVLVLYLPCRWFADLKRRRRDAWLSYF